MGPTSLATMEAHQELEKPIFELLHHSRKVRSSRTKKNRTMNHYEEIFCYYGLRQSPKRTTTTQKKPKKRLIRCGECGKGFRYEKCLRNHSETMHSLEEKKKKKKKKSEESRRRDLLCFFSSGGVQRRKRSKRVSRYKKKSLPPLSVSSSTFANDGGELFEVAESLLMLSKSGDALFSNLEMNQIECGDEQKLVGKFTDGWSLSNGTSRELLGFLGDNKVMREDESGQLKHVGAGRFREEVAVERVSLEDRPGMVLKKAETDTEQKLGGQEAASMGLPMNNEEHKCRLCERVFSTYQALGGHQTFHRMKNSCEKSKHEMQRRLSNRS